MLISSKLSRFFCNKNPRGFTLIELLVVSIIIILITTFVLFRQQGFNSSTLLRSLSYSVALSVRQAQVYSVSVRESTPGSGVFAPGYGVLFAVGDAGAPLADNAHYFLFADTNGNGQYAAGEELPRYTIGGGRGSDYKISNFCAHTNTGNQCLAGTSVGITSLAIYFRRPSADACIASSQSLNACAPGAVPPYSYNYAYIQLQSTGSTNTRTVKVTSTGQIAVCNLNADVSTC